MEAPDEIAGASVERKRRPRAALHSPLVALGEPAERREVDEAVQDRRRPHDPARRAEAPAEVTRSRVEGREVPVPGPDEHHVPPDGRGRVDVGPGLASPEQVPGGRPVGIHRPIGVAEEDASVGNRGGGVEVLPTAEARERLRTPARSSCSRADRVDAAPVRAHVDGPVRVRRCADDLVVRLVAPEHAIPLLAHIERIDLAIPRAEVEDAADKQRRGLDRTCLEAPFRAAGPGVERHDHPAPRGGGVLRARPAVHQGDVESPARDRGRAGDAVRELPPPDDLSEPGVDGDQDAAASGKEYAVVRDHGRGLERAPRPERPEACVRRPEPERREARPLDVVAVQRPGLLGELLARSLLRLLRGDELGRRGAAHRAVALLVPGPPAGDGATRERSNRDHQQRPAEEAESTLEEAPREREDNAGCEQKLGGLGDCAFQRRCEEEQGPGQTSGATDERRRLPLRCARSRSPSRDSGLPGSALES